MNVYHNVRKESKKIREIVEGYEEDEKNGVVKACNGLLDIRPMYQRDFVYDLEKQRKVIDTIIKQLPLNIFYWGSGISVGKYELIDGQQRTISICRFIKGKFTIYYNGEEKYFQNLPAVVQDLIFNYELEIYIYIGPDSEKLEWFKRINISSLSLNDQELRNATYIGPFVISAKKYFSGSRTCPALDVGGSYINEDAVRQKVLEKVLTWAADYEKAQSIEEYMQKHIIDDASNLWMYFTSVIAWVDSLFGKDIPGMKSQPWGILYNAYHAEHSMKDGCAFCVIKATPGFYTKSEIIEEVLRLRADGMVTANSGIYEYILSGDVRKLSLRKFDENIKMMKFNAQGGLCAHCGRKFKYEDLVTDHIVPWSRGGTSTLSNCQLLCASCNNNKSDMSDVPVDSIVCPNCGKYIDCGSKFCSECGQKL